MSYSKKTPWTISDHPKSPTEYFPPPRIDGTRWVRISSTPAPVTFYPAYYYCPSNWDCQHWAQRRNRNTRPTQRDYTNQVQPRELTYQELPYLMGNTIGQHYRSSVHLVKTTEPIVRTITDPTKGKNLNSDSVENSTRNKIQVHETTDFSKGEKNTFDIDGEQRRPTRYSDDGRTCVPYDKPASHASVFVGLTNTGNSCCVNVLLQTLFMTPEYRNLLSRCQQEGILKNESDHVLYQLHKMFQYLQDTTKRIALPFNFIRCLSLNNINMEIQLDAEEIFRSLFCLIQNQLKETDIIADLNKLYIITIEEYTKCLECLQEIKQIGNMLTIPLSVYISSTRNFHGKIENSLASFFEPVRLDVGNMYYCDQCGKKTIATRSCRVISYPQILCLHLKRFYTYLGMTLKSYVFMEFPESLHLKNFGEESHRQMDKFQYHLMSVIVHVGSASFGHYYAYIRSFPEMDWYCFMDERVRKATWEEVKSTFGSSQSDSGLSGYQMGGTAYLLFYRRID